MTRRAVPYPVPGFAVRIPAGVWDAALAELRRYATLGESAGPGPPRPGSEALVYLGGVVVAGELLVTSLCCLDHEPQGDRVAVTPTQAKWLLRTLRERDEKLIGQVHSHRGLAGHSLGDDLHATSFHDGFLSIVAPFFGHDIAEPAQCAVLEYRDGAFADLTPAEIRARLRIELEIVRRAEPVCPPVPPTPTQEPPWTRCARRLRSIARWPR